MTQRQAPKNFVQAINLNVPSKRTGNDSGASEPFIKYGIDRYKNDEFFIKFVQSPFPCHWKMD